MRTRLSLGAAIALTVAGIAIRVAFLFHAVPHAGDIRWPDEQNYYLPAAQSILQDGLSFFLTPRSLWNGPLNPLWIAFWHADVAATRFANIVMLSLAGLCLWDLARRWWGHGAALGALLLFTLYPQLNDFSGSILTEPPFTALLIFSAWVALRGGGEKRREWAAGGMAFALAALTRPTVQAFPWLWLFASLGVCALPRAGGPARRLLRQIVIPFVAGYALVAGPYLIKNIMLFNSATIANGAGAVLYLGNDLRRGGDEPIYSGVDFDTSRYTKEFTHLDQEGDRRLREEAMRRIQAHPFDTALLVVQKALRLMFGYARYYFYPYRSLPQMYAHAPAGSTALTVLEMCMLAGTGVFAFAALLHAGVMTWPARALIGALAIYFVSLHSLLFAIPRMMVPLYPLLALAATGTLRAGRRTVAWASAATLSAVVAISLHGAREHPELVSETFVGYHSADLELTPQSETARHDVNERTIAIGARPAVDFDGGAFQAQRNQIVFVWLKARGPKSQVSETGSLTLAWKHQSDAEIMPGPEVPVRLDGEEHIYRLIPALDARWPGALATLQLRLTPNLPGARYQLRRIVVAH